MVYVFLVLSQNTSKRNCKFQKESLSKGQHLIQIHLLALSCLPAQCHKTVKIYANVGKVMCVYLYIALCLS